MKRTGKESEGKSGEGVNESQKGGQEGQTTLVTDGGSGEKKSKGWV